MAENSVDLSIPFPSSRCATIAYEVLNVDQEVKRSGVVRNLDVEEEVLKINLQAEDLKKLRVSLNGILKNILLIAKTIELFPN